MKIPVDGHSGFYRDKNSGAILNCNLNEYQEYLKLKSIKISEKNEIESLKNEINELKTILNKVLMEKI